MGPGLYSPGYAVDYTTFKYGGLLLQWGRAYTARDTSQPASQPASLMLQWGRAYTARDTGQSHDSVGSGPRASMGPGLYSPGYVSASNSPSVGV